MYNNDILRRLRFSLDLSDTQLVAYFGGSGLDISAEQANHLLRKEDMPDSIPCSDRLMTAFLDNLIIDRRGPPREGATPPKRSPMSNNVILKKLRIALNLKEEDMLNILSTGGQAMSKGELSALFRKPDHKHFRPCGDQAMRAFLRGLNQRFRPEG
jgi:uncharacterized protein YehS (DUF1456 family)